MIPILVDLSWFDKLWNTLAPTTPEAIWIMTGTLVALLLPLVGKVWSWFSEWARRSALKVGFDQHKGYSSWTADQNNFKSLWVRIPTRNKEGKLAARNVEVFLTSIKPENPAQMLVAYLPVRLKWAHGGSFVCDRIAPGGMRLFDLGKIPLSAPIVFNFVSESRQISLSAGVYSLEFLIVCDGANPIKSRWKLSIFDNPAEETQESDHYVKLEKIP